MYTGSEALVNLVLDHGGNDARYPRCIAVWDLAAPFDALKLSGNALHFAAVKGRPGIVELVIDRVVNNPTERVRVDVFDSTNYGLTALNYAVIAALPALSQPGRVRVRLPPPVAGLRGQGADPDFVDWFRLDLKFVPSIAHAIAFASTPILRLLLEGGATTAAQGHAPPLHRCTLTEEPAAANLESMQMLLGEYGVDVNAYNSDRAKALEVAKHLGLDDAACLLLLHGAKKTQLPVICNKLEGTGWSDVMCLMVRRIHSPLFD